MGSEQGVLDRRAALFHTKFVMRDFVAQPTDAGKRLDQFLVEQLVDVSRVRAQRLLRAGRVQMNGEAAKVSYRLRGGEQISLDWEPSGPLRTLPEDIPLEVIYEDGELAAVNKPAGMAVHPGAGRLSGTLINALLHRFEALSQLGGESRPGIVHRLDRQTSGLLLVAKNDVVHRHMADQFRNRAVVKTYLALVHGVVEPEQDQITAPIARDLWRRRRMTARRKGTKAREALTEYKVLRRLPRFTLLKVTLHTGRTHQARVHLASRGHPVVGDTLYGAPGGLLDRNFLHAASIAFQHPRTGQTLEISAPLPPELERFLASIAE